MALTLKWPAEARIAMLERQLEAARREIAALTLSRDAALRLATWGSRSTLRRATEEQKPVADRQEVLAE